MIYLDSSVALADILRQERRPASAFWMQRFTSSRLLQYEVWNRLHAYQASAYRHEKARAILKRIGYQEMTGTTLIRALRPFPYPIRTLDGLHLATMDHLRTRGIFATLATYDRHLGKVATAMGFDSIEP